MTVEKRDLLLRRLFSAVFPGIVPKSGGGTTNFLRADGTWAAPVGGAVSSVSTSDAALTVTPTTGAVVASANDFTTSTHGTVPASGGGTTNFLRADGTWAVPPGSGGGFSGVPGTIPDLNWWWESDNILAGSGKTITCIQNRVPWLSAGHLAYNVTTQYQGATRSASTLNSLPVLSWPGNNNGNYSMGTQTPSLTEATMFVVINPANFTNYMYVLGGPAQSLSLRIDQTTGKASLIQTTTGLVGANSVGLTANSWVQLNATYSASNTNAWAFRVGRAAGSSGNAAGISITAGMSGIGWSVGEGLPYSYNGLMAATIVYNRVLTAGEITSVENYIFNKWGV